MESAIENGATEPAAEVIPVENNLPPENSPSEPEAALPQSSGETPSTPASETPAENLVSPVESQS